MEFIWRQFMYEACHLKMLCTLSRELFYMMASNEETLTNDSGARGGYLWITTNESNRLHTLETLTDSVSRCTFLQFKTPRMSRNDPTVSSYCTILWPR